MFLAVLLIFSCHQTNTKFCKSNLIALDKEFNLVLNECINVDSLIESNGDYGQYALFSIYCKNKKNEKGYISSTSFDITDKQKRSISNVNIIFLVVGMDLTEDFYIFCQNELKEIFQCNNTLKVLINKVPQLGNIKEFTIKYRKLRFSLKLESENMIVLNINIQTKKRDINTVYENVDFFKYLVFRKCLENGYNDSEDVNAILNEELLLVDFPYGIETFKLIDSLSHKVKSKIESDSIFLKEKWLTKNSDFENLRGKRVIAHCLDYYISPELDSIAKNYRINKQ